MIVIFFLLLIAIQWGAYYNLDRSLRHWHHLALKYSQVLGFFLLSAVFYIFLCYWLSDENLIDCDHFNSGLSMSNSIIVLYFLGFFTLLVSHFTYYFTKYFDK